MSNFPSQIDDDITLPPINDNLSEIGSEAINALRDAAFAIENNIGIGAAGTTNSIAERLAVSFNPDGTPNASLVASMGLVPGSVYDIHVNSAAAIKESKLDLDYNTQDLYNNILNNASEITQALNWISITGSKLEPHLSGSQYRHELSDLDVGTSSSYFYNKFGALRNNTNSYTAINDINSELVSHQKLDGSTVTSSTMTSNSGFSFPANYAHPAAGIFLDVRNFTFIPQTANDLQKFADFMNSSNTSVIGTRIQSFYANGISRTARSSSLITDTTGFNSTVGQAVVTYTSAKSYLLEGSNTSPVDNIDTGDDLIEFFPTSTGNVFDAQFSQVNIGDIVTINYENVNGSSLIVSYIIKEKKYNIDDLGNKRYLVRINSINILGSDYLAVARIDKPLFNINKYGVLALSQVHNSFGSLPSLISGSPRGAVALGTKFDPDLITSTNYKLYIQFYPNGNPTSSVNNLPGIDITGNLGATPGKYTLDSIIETMNNKFRSPGFNYRFMAFQYQGQLGIMVADSYNNASFSIVAGVLDPSTGIYNQTLSNTSYPNNVIDLFNNRDPLGLGPGFANLASPPYAASFSIPELAQTPTRILVPLKRNNYYVDGAESEKLTDGYLTTKDNFDNGYWDAIITNKVIVPGVRLGVSYIVDLNLSSSNLKIGKTITVQPASSTIGSYVDYGRFIISDIQFVKPCGSTPASTTITVYDAVHATASTPFASSPVGTAVRLYFDDGSIGFNSENVSDINSVGPFKRFFETYINKNGHTFTHERARINISGTTQTINSDPEFNIYTNSSLSLINFFNVSPKLRGYQTGNYNKITLFANYNNTTGVIDGYLGQYDGVSIFNIGPITTGKKGEVVRFYDETVIDYIDFIFDIDDTISTFTGAIIDIQLYPTLSLDDEVMILGTCQINDSLKTIKNLRDTRQFGNISEKQLSTSAIDFVNAGNRLLHQNGVIKGLDIVSATNNSIVIKGGTVLVNGNFININNATLNVPLIQEFYSSTTFTKINWLLCINNKNDFEFIPLTDYDSVSPVTPNAPNRVFVAKNPITSTLYNIDSKTFAEIVNTRKDLVILYKVTTDVNSSGVLNSALLPNNIHDARKYAFESDATIYPVLTSENAQGNFYNFDSLASWLTYNSNYITNVGIKGSVTVSSTYIFNSSNIIKFNGNNVSTLTFASGSNVIFTNCHFYDLPITINSGAIVSFVNCVFDGCTIILNQSLTLSNNKFVNSTITVNSANGFVINNDDISFEKCTFNYTYNSASDVGYNTSNKINIGFGMITVSNASAFQRKNLTILNSKFITTTSDHYPVICIEFNHAESHYQDIIIQNNRFYSTASGDDTRGMVIFSNNVITLGGLEGPRLVNTHIDNNLFDKNQIIAIISKADGSSFINNALSTINCNISNNTCGAIGFLTRYETHRNYTNSSNLVRDKESLLTIEKNNCKLIDVMSQIGAQLSSWGFVEIETGKVIINNNSVGALRVGLKSNSASADEKRAALIMTNNIIAALPSTDTFFAGYACQVSGPPASNERVGEVIFANNLVDFGTSVNSDGTTKVTGYFTNGYLNTSIAAKITGNTFKGLGNSSSSSIGSPIIQVDGDCIITENIINRGSFTLSGIGCYIGLAGGHSIVTENAFDSTTIDGSSEELLKSFGGTAVYERNKNQISYITVPLIHDTAIGNRAGSTDGYGTYYHTLTDSGISGYLRVKNFDDTNFKSQYLDVQTNFDNGAPLATRVFNKNINIDNLLPNKVKILQAKCGFWAYAGDYMFLDTGSVTLRLTTFNKNDLSATSITDVRLYTLGGTDTSINFNAENIYNIAGSYSIEPSTSATQYVTINTLNYSSSDVSANFITSENYLITAQIIVKLGNSSGDTLGFLNLRLSPIVIKYRW